jgi:hypothetical protein
MDNGSALAAVVHTGELATGRSNRDGRVPLQKNRISALHNRTAACSKNRQTPACLQDDDGVVSS